jgi:hypothetical protein
MKVLWTIIVILAACACSSLDRGEWCDHQCEGVPDRERPDCYAACMGQEADPGEAP